MPITEGKNERFTKLRKMIDTIYIFIFGHFYFYEPSLLVNYTVCLKICDEREMKLPTSNNNDIILRQMKSLRIDKFNLSNALTLKNARKNYLTYFIGRFTNVFC